MNAYDEIARARQAPLQRSISRRRSAGMALLVVMVAFVLMYLVVYQLHFSSGMEARIAQVRFGEVESSVALQSAARYVLTLLVEDLKSGMNQGNSAASTSQTTSAAGSVGVSGAPGGNFTPLAASSASSGTGKWYTYLHQNVFSDNQQQVGNVNVKIRIVDGERKFDLNRLFDYVTLDTEDLVAGEEDLRGELENLAATGEDASGLSRREQILKNLAARRPSSSSSAQGSSRGESGADAASAGGVSGAAGSEAEAGGDLDQYEPDEQFIPPDGVRLQATQDMVERAVLMMISINENEYGYRYADQYSSAEVARAIVDYVIERRGSPYQNRIFLVSELLTLPEVTRELFYGPYPQLATGEEFSVGNGFVLQRDEFGDITPVYENFMEDPFLEERRTTLENLQGQYGRFMDFPGLGRLESNALTRGMSEPVVELDEYGNEYIPQTPVPIGLEDIFTAFSSGKININTAPVPVLFALLLSLSEDEANEVALDIRDYRNQFQEEVDPETGAVDAVEGSGTPDLGQPRRERVEEDEEALGTAGDYGLGEYGADDLGGAVAPYQDLETNYFTSLQQLELIDGTDGGPTDRMRRDEGVARVGVEGDTLFRRVLHDYQKVIVFGSTYFEAELKGKAQDGRPGKTGYLTVKRDPKQETIEVLLWRTLQK